MKAFASFPPASFRPLWKPSLVLFLLLFPLCRAGQAFDGQKVQQGPLTLEILDIPTVTQWEKPQTVRVRLHNSGNRLLSVRVKIGGLVDEWRSLGHTEQQVKLKPSEETVCRFQIVAGRGCLSALYPVHVWATFSEKTASRQTAHAVQIFSTDFTKQKAAHLKALPVVSVPAYGTLLLNTLKDFQVEWQWFNKPLRRMPVGWTGSVPDSRTNVAKREVARGKSLPAFTMHPPWRPRAGTVFLVFRLQLPQTRPIRLTFFNAIRDNIPPEPPSDGVTFRVWVNDQMVFERHTASKRWVPGQVDLSQFAGRQITLKLESHPGPKRNTVCDQSFWGAPALIVGNVPQTVAPPEVHRTLCRLARKAVETGETLPLPKLKGRPAGVEHVYLFPLAGGGRAALAVGPNGLADAALAFGFSQKKSVVFDGFQIEVENMPVGRWPSSITTQAVTVKQKEDGRLVIQHKLSLENKPFVLTAELRADGPALRLRVQCSRRLSRVAIGPADQPAPRVYYGHGFCIQNPQTFRASGGGHNLSTSHVGFDFQRGLSLLVACSTPVDYLQVTPDQHLYSLFTHPDTTFTFVPGENGALDCAVRFRPLSEKKAAGGVRRKAGRFCFDIWGGRYSENRQQLQRCFQYGLTDSLVIFHVWQRWGYDYRLPDIFPPNPALGTLEDLRAVSDLCAEHDVPFGLHDNYIDFYPDATGYSYEHICFTQDGRPIKAWLNQSRNAQSYRWRPDHFQPFLERNLHLIKPALHPTAYFIDVFTSANCFDYYDRQGHFHSKLETQRCWGHAFEWIRNYLGGNAPTVSEAGGDHLIGYIDGADCQFLQLSPKPKRFCIHVACEDWERVPWFDLVHHTRLSLHGVGYSGRYEGGRSRDLHGIVSDDYISTELLTGHALMIDRLGLVREAVRKYWLAQDFIRSLAQDEIQKVEFADGNMHRLIVYWNSGATVYVNRSTEEWNVKGHRLPQYGYYAKSGDGKIESCIERLDGAVVEWSRNGRAYYVNGRGDVPDPPLRIRPTANRLEYLGGRRFKLYIDWHAEAPAPRDLTVFMHFFKPQVSRLKLVGWYGGGGKPRIPTSRWHGTVTTGARWTLTIPENLPAGRYEVLVGLYAPEQRGKRYKVLGDLDSQRRCRIGTLVVERRKGKVTNVRLEPAKSWPDEPLAERLLPNTHPVHFGVASTTGAFRIVPDKHGLQVTPLPDWPSTSLSLNLNRLFGRPVEVAEVSAWDQHGQRLRSVPFKANSQTVSFKTKRGEFSYRVKLKP